MTCDSDIASEEGIRDMNRGTYMLRYTIAKSVGLISGKPHKGANNATATSNCDIALEGIQSDRRKVLMNGEGFL